MQHFLKILSFSLPWYASRVHIWHMPPQPIINVMFKCFFYNSNNKSGQIREQRKLAWDGNVYIFTVPHISPTRSEGTTKATLLHHRHFTWAPFFLKSPATRLFFFNDLFSQIAIKHEISAHVFSLCGRHRWPTLPPTNGLEAKRSTMGSFLAMDSSKGA